MEKGRARAGRGLGMAAGLQNPGVGTSTGYSALADTTGDSSVKCGLLAEAGALQGGVDRGSGEAATRILGGAGQTAEWAADDEREQAEWEAMLLEEFPMEDLTMEERNEMFLEAVMAMESMMEVVSGPPTRDGVVACMHVCRFQWLRGVIVTSTW